LERLSRESFPEAHYSMSKKRIAILFHEKDRKTNWYAIHFLAECWREDGLDVIFVFGPNQFIPADLAILHVNLSVVPPEYLELAHRYPIVLNGEAKDIRKSSFSINLIKPGEPFCGKVIVKTDLNYAGWPERTFNRPFMGSRLLTRFWLRFGFRNTACLDFQRPVDYRIYDNPRDVPPAYFKCKDVVVEKFLPEQDGDLYFVRQCHFLGNQVTCARIASKQPVVTSSTRISREIVEPHPEIMELRRRLKFDYGKFDYVIHDGKATLLDINKTPGTGASARATKIAAGARQRAAGIYSYLNM
jgi:hypothetical protein